MRNDENAGAAEISALAGHITETMKTRLEYERLLMIDKVSVIYARHLSAGLLMNFVFLFLLFVSTGIALWLGMRWGSDALGFTSVGGAYCVIVLLFMIIRRRLIEKKMTDLIIAELCKEYDYTSSGNTSAG